MSDFNDVLNLLDLGFLETIIIIRTNPTTKIFTKLNKFNNDYNYCVIYKSNFYLKHSCRLQITSQNRSQVFVEIF